MQEDQMTAGPATLTPSIVYVFIGNGNWNVAANWQDGFDPAFCFTSGLRDKDQPFGNHAL
jgi:hypothetical protein